MTDPIAFRSRTRTLLQQGVDVLIVGGGINGAGLARDLALRGARVGLVEKNDFGWGTSSRSSRLIHGGLRYLEHGEIGLVFESVTERYWLSRLARNLVRPQPFVFPAFEGSRVPLWKMGIGLSIYDALALFRNYRNHRRITREQVLELMPTLDGSRLKGAVHYYDYRTNDARLTLENVIAAEEAGALVMSRVCAIAPKLGIADGQRRLLAVRVRDELRGDELEIPVGVVVSATGPWTDSALAALGYPMPATPLLRPTKGVHIVVPRAKLPLNAAAALTHPRDGRVLFALPFFERSVLGTTDTDWTGSPDDVRVDLSDVDYLLEVAAHYFPSSKLTRDDVIASWAGLRPLMNATGEHASAVSREHRILATSEGLIAVFGGKLTTYRRMVEEIADLVADALRERGRRSIPPGSTRGAPLPAADTLDSDQDMVSLRDHIMHRAGVPLTTAAHLVESYGDRVTGLLEMAAVDPTGRLKLRVDPELPHVWVQVAWAARHEHALTIEDALVRRTNIHYRAMDAGIAAGPIAADVMARELGWSDAERRDQLAAWERFVAQSRRWRDEARAGEPARKAV